MKTRIIETQVTGKKRTYLIDGPQYSTVLEFWAWLKAMGTIEDYAIGLADD